MKPNLVSFLAALALGAVFAPHQGQAQSLLYGLTASGGLVRFSDSGGTVVPTPPLSGIGASESAVAIDFRPFNGDLYLLTRDTENLGRLYTVNPTTGIASSVALSGPALLLTGQVDIDFNPAALNGVNALRIVTSDRHNYRLVFTAEGATVNVDGDLNRSGDGPLPMVIATAYANNRAGLPGSGGAGGTSQFALDLATQSLVRVNPPNAGTLTEPMPLGLEFSAAGGLDVVTGTDRALAILNVSDATGLYEINLTNGMTTLARSLPMDLVDLAAPIPVSFPDLPLYGLTSSNALIALATTGTNVGMPIPITSLSPSETAAAIDFRPFTGELYLVTRDPDSLGQLYTVDPITGIASAIALSGPPLMVTGQVDIDFNPAALNGVNALRIVTSDRHNYRLVFTAEGATVNVDGDLNRSGDGPLPMVIATAYANNASGLPGGGGAGGTSQFALDLATHSLVRVNPPNAGTLTEPMPLGLEFTGMAGLDILTASDRAMAVLKIGETTGLYEINLTSGAPTWIRSLPETLIDASVPMPVSLQAPALSGSQRSLNWSGGVGPFAVLRADVVSDPFCAVATVATRTLNLEAEGPAGFFSVADLALNSPVAFSVKLNGAAERPNPVATDAMGSGTLELSGDTLHLNFTYQGLSGPALAAHIHGPAMTTTTAGVLVDLQPLHQGPFAQEGTFSGTVRLNPTQRSALLSGLAYVNIHTGNHPDGEIRGQIAPVHFQTSLSGDAERPGPANTSATGFARLSLDGSALALEIFYHDLSGPAVAAHLHGPANASGTGEVLVDLAPLHDGDFSSSGLFSGSLTLTDAQRAALIDGHIYVNIHTDSFPGGELRGQLRPSVVGQPVVARLTGAAERPNPVETDAGGLAALTLQGDQLQFRIGYQGLSGPALAAHFHGPANADATAGVLMDLGPFHRGPLDTSGVFAGSVVLLPEQKAALLRGEVYINIHTAAHPDGELRGQLVP